MINKHWHFHISRPIWVVIGSSLFYWLFDSAIDAFVLQKGGLLESLFFPDGTKLVGRLLVLGIVAINGAYFHKRLALSHRIKAAFSEKDRITAQMSTPIKAVFWMMDCEEEEMVYVSPGYEEIWGRSRESLYSSPRSWIDSIHPEDRERVLKSALIKQTRGEYIEEYKIIRSDGSIRWILDRAFPIRNNLGDVYRVAGIAEDITERKGIEAKMKHLAFYDPITNLPNRLLLFQHLRQTIQRAQRNGERTALLLMDIDRFREINDTLGHHHGDILLQKIGALLRDVLWEPDLVSRLGGDEFAVLLPKISKVEDIDVVINKIVEALEVPIMVEDLPIRIDISMGIALYPDHGTDAETLMQRADVAMYTAKHGGNGCRIYSPEQDQCNPRQLALMGELRKAIADDQLLLHYQPKIDFKKASVVGMEALVRWQHPEYGMIPPDQFIGPSERTGLIWPLTQWTLRAALHQYRYWQEVGLDFKVAVNLSVRCLQYLELPSLVAELLQEFKVSPGGLILEITESAMMSNVASAMVVLAKLSDLGIGISIDDYGTGYTSLSYLKKLPVEEIKIDRFFIKDILTDVNDAVIARSIIDLGHNLGLRVVGEGVESQETMEFLATIGCDEVQGYFISKPLPAEEVIYWISQSPWDFG